MHVDESRVGVGITLFVGHKNKTVVADWGRHFAPVPSADDWSETVVKNTEEAAKAKRQLIPNAGKRANGKAIALLYILYCTGAMSALRP